MLERMARTKLLDYRPFPKQREFHANGARYRERLFMAGNQLGKTLAGAFEGAMHLTGRYPKWWEGRVFQKPHVAWVASVSGELVRDGAQRMLMGRPDAWGTGSIPTDAIVEIQRKAHGFKDAIESVIVRHGGGGDVQAGHCRIGFKSYDQGYEKFQAETLGWVWLDEEPPDIELYTEALTRTNLGDDGHMGMLYMTFTPLKGVSDVVARYLLPNKEGVTEPGTIITQMGINDAEQYDAEAKATIIASYPEHLRDAKAYGTPLFGSGMVFQVNDETITCDYIHNWPDYWPSIIGLDFGWDHPSAAAKLRWNRDDDIVIVVGAVRKREATPLMFAEQIRSWHKWVPVAWGHDGLQHDKGSGIVLAKQYADQGLNMLDHPASFSDEKLEHGVEAGIAMMLDRMISGRFFVMPHLQEWFEEKRTYHRKDGIIVNVRDDIMCATRYAIMELRHAACKPMRSKERADTNWKTI